LTETWVHLPFIGSGKQYVTVTTVTRRGIGHFIGTSPHAQGFTFHGSEGPTASSLFPGGAA